MLSVISVFNKKHQWSHQTELSVKSVLSVFNKNISGLTKQDYPCSIKTSVVQLWSQTVERRRRQMARWVVVLISRQTCREVATRR